MQWTIRFLVVCNMSKNATIFPQSLCTTLVAISRQMDRGNENSSDWAIWYVSSSRMSQSNPQNNVNILALTLRYTSFSEKSSKTDEGYGVRYRVSTNPRTWHQKIYFTEPASFFKPGMNVILIESLIESSTVQIEKASSRDKLLKFHHLLISPMTPPRLLKASWNCGISWCFADVFTPPQFRYLGPPHRNVHPNAAATDVQLHLDQLEAFRKSSEAPRNVPTVFRIGKCSLPEITPSKIDIWTQKWKMTFVFNWVNSMFQVNFQGCNISQPRVVGKMSFLFGGISWFTGMCECIIPNDARVYR